MNKSTKLDILDLKSIKEEWLRTLTTPFYLYDINLLTKTLIALTKSTHKFPTVIHYAIKANNNDKILEKIKSYNIGVDCVSANEIKKGIEIGFKPQKIVFAGVGKADWEIEYALKNDIYCFNCESCEEVEVIDNIASKLNKKFSYAFRINPNVDPKTHAYISTGKSYNKFGISFDEILNNLNKIDKIKNGKFRGIHFHIGSQIVTDEPFYELCEYINYCLFELKKLKIEIEDINVGGGLGINYHNPEQEPIPNFQNYFNIFNENLKLDSHQTLHYELGRSIVGQCGALITKVLFLKGGEKKFLICDGGMTEVIRPALYQSHHKIENITSKSEEKEIYEVVGPICESSDFLGKNVELPLSKRGDYLIVKSTGAYCEVLSSNYNLREKAPVVCV